MIESEKREAFSRIFPPRVEKLIKALDVLSNCSNKSGYLWNQDLIHDVFVTIAQIFREKAKLFGVEFEVLVDGIEVGYVEPKTKKRTAKQKTGREGALQAMDRIYEENPEAMKRLAQEGDS